MTRVSLEGVGRHEAVGIFLGECERLSVGRRE
jgi:hypothetical protein